MLRFEDRPVDDPVVQELLGAYFAERAAGFPASQGAYSPTYPAPAQFVPPAGVFLVASDDDSPTAGCGGVRRVQRADDLLVRFEVKHLWVHPDSRGRGYGRLLLAELERRARSLGGEFVVLDTNESLAAAGGLYRSTGYAEIEPYNANPNATHWYGKRLAAG
ncbi:GNAT family N-acetyltransferase [Agromyces atrinae]|uniref:GNAT family N-acetyltransferase n=1 Tax=Agromyces atrinae TaxID=592376 RepID=UPI001F5AC22F|nr:GNAT family N-acetyltransferase [Agromyces atrinae]MCI2958933.1 GNAT family N-acetyltransferase [Agromyces atrinae]